MLKNLAKNKNKHTQGEFVNILSFTQLQDEWE